ncbi:hypothetical protein NNA36_15990 [Shimia sp. CNT1-13L.2]|uniref:hypothetical protein n=1 Tax=Shimia sp. CNT1-13L.2 TaxID=2959663 RepID=UPI0020CF0B14|nr:hypothetical protein [Shimia sp. CNT1-13L.2]MCP9483466.1 hypothetical protein [Shimia sp. CNT1-13L.2]
MKRLTCTVILTVLASCMEATPPTSTPTEAVSGKQFTLDVKRLAKDKAEVKRHKSYIVEQNVSLPCNRQKVKAYATQLDSDVTRIQSLQNAVDGVPKKPTDIAMSRAQYFSLISQITLSENAVYKAASQHCSLGFNREIAATQQISDESMARSVAAFQTHENLKNPSSRNAAAGDYSSQVGCNLNALGNLTTRLSEEGKRRTAGKGAKTQTREVVRVMDTLIPVYESFQRRCNVNLTSEIEGMKRTRDGAKSTMSLM